MKEKSLIIVATALTLVLGVGSTRAAIAVEEAQVAIVIEYVQVPTASASWFERITTEAMHPHHEKMAAAAEIFAWYTYRVRFPLGDASSYNHVIVTVYSDPSAIPSRDEELPYRDYIAAREIYEPVTQSEGYATIATPYVTVSFLRAADGEPNAFLESFQRDIRPHINELVVNGKWKTWGLFVRKDPGTSTAHDYALVARHVSFDGAETPFPGPSENDGPILMKSELWKLIDIVLAEEPAGESP